MMNIPLQQFGAAATQCLAGSRGIVLASVLATSLLSGSCSIVHRRAAPLPDCNSLARDAVPFDSVLAIDLTGEYEVSLVDTGTAPRATAIHRGRLKLWAQDSLRRYSGPPGTPPPSRGVDRPIAGSYVAAWPDTGWGWRRLASVDPDHPGVVWSLGRLRMGGVDVPDGTSEDLAVDWISADGFGGTWTSNMDIAVHVDSTGRAFQPRGYYCARRVAGTLGSAIVGVLSDSVMGVRLPDYPVSIRYAGRRPGDNLAGARKRPPFSRETRTDDTGAFRFEDVPPAPHNVTTRGILLEPIAVDVNPRPGDTIHLSLAFRPLKPPPEDPARRSALLASLDSARQRWLARRPVKYEAAVELYCFCLGNNGPITVEVHDDSVVRTADRSGQPHPPDAIPQGLSVDALFRAIEAEMRDDHRRIHRAQYHPGLGYPISVRTDSPFGVTDQWLEYRILSLRVIR